MDDERETEVEREGKSNCAVSDYRMIDLPSSQNHVPAANTFSDSVVVGLTMVEEREDEEERRCVVRLWSCRVN